MTGDTVTVRIEANTGSVITTIRARIVVAATVVGESPSRSPKCHRHRPRSLTASSSVPSPSSEIDCYLCPRTLQPISQLVCRWTTMMTMSNTCVEDVRWCTKSQREGNDEQASFGKPTEMTSRSKYSTPQTGKTCWMSKLTGSW